MTTFLILVGAVALLAWLVLVLAWGGFWRTRERLDEMPPEPAAWPSVVAVVPARNEAAVIGRTIGSLLAQDYLGPFRIVLVDDHSQDGTAGIAQAAALASSRAERLEVVTSRPLPGGWTGKLWALSEGVREAERIAPEAPFLWFTDADIAHDPASLRRLVAKAQGEGLDLVSLMVRLGCSGFWERLLIPPFVFFFAMLYPFAWVNDPRRRMAAAAGGCVLLRREALARAGGVASIRGEIIDDCALGRRLKAGGPIWLGLTTKVESVRPYAGLGEIWAMVARSAFAQLHYSAALLVLTVLGLALVYLAPPLLLLAWPLHGSALVAGLGAGAWILMAVAIRPMQRLYGLGHAWAAALPLVALLYAGMTMDSALAHWRGRGGQWKGRVQGGTVEGDAPLRR